jgi:hypothetical protein
MAMHTHAHSIAIYHLQSVPNINSPYTLFNYSALLRPQLKKKEALGAGTMGTNGESLRMINSRSLRQRPFTATS